MAEALMVTRAFGDHAIGQIVTDPAEIASVLEAHPHFVVSVAKPEQEAPAVLPAPVLNPEG